MGGDETKKQLDAMEADLNALLSKYGIKDLESLEPGPEMQDDPAGAMKAINAAIGDIDHAQFMIEAFALADKYADEDKKGKNPLGKVGGEVTDIDVHGDRGEVTVEGHDEPMPLIKHEGRWYVGLPGM